MELEIYNDMHLPDEHIDRVLTLDQRDDANIVAWYKEVLAAVLDQVDLRKILIGSNIDFQDKALLEAELRKRVPISFAHEFV